MVPVYFNIVDVAFKFWKDPLAALHETKVSLFQVVAAHELIPTRIITLLSKEPAPVPRIDI